MSRWSASMLVTTATVGVSARNERSYSSASTTYRRSPPAQQIPFPRGHAAADERRGVATRRGERDRRHDGRRRLAVRARDGDELAPAVTSPSASARRITGTPSSRARTSSGWSFGIADVTTSARAPSTCDGIVRLDDHAEALEVAPPIGIGVASRDRHAAPRGTARPARSCRRRRCLRNESDARRLSRGEACA